MLRDLIYCKESEDLSSLVPLVRFASSSKGHYPGVEMGVLPSLESSTSCLARQMKDHMDRAASPMYFSPSWVPGRR